MCRAGMIEGTARLISEGRHGWRPSLWIRMLAILLYGYLVALGCSDGNGPSKPVVQGVFSLPAALGGHPDSLWEGGLTWDGSGFWTKIGDEFVKLGISGELVGQLRFSPSGSDGLGCLEWDGSHLWIAAGDSIHRVEPQSGQAVKSLPTPIRFGSTEELVWDGANLWVYGGGSPIVPTWYRVDESGGPLDSLRPVLGNYGAAWDGQRLCCITHPGRYVPNVYYSDFYRVNQMGEMSKVLRFDGVVLEQLAFDGHDFFCVAQLPGGRLWLCRLIF